MENIEIEKHRESWFLEEKNRLEVNKKRRYLHFDDRVTSLSKEHLVDVWNPDHVAGHSFYPFIRDDQKKRRYKRRNGKKVIEEKIRPISYASHYDALIFSWYAYLLAAAYEEKVVALGVSENAIAYRKGRSTLEYAKDVFEFIALQENCVAIAFDVEGFFDNLDHAHLKSEWAKVIGATNFLPPDHYAVFKAVSKFDYAEKTELFERFKIQPKDAGRLKRISSPRRFRFQVRTEVNGKKLIKKNLAHGIPQGAPISAVLSNIYMLSFDEKLAVKVKEVGGLYRRYCDDIIVICPTEKKEDLTALVQHEIEDLKLAINPSKTEVRYFKKNDGRLICQNEEGKPAKLQYLGVEFDGSRYYLRHRGFANYQRKMTRAVGATAKWAAKRGQGIPKTRLYERFSPFGRHNFLTYGKQAIKSFKGSEIARQLSFFRVMKKLRQRIIRAKKTDSP